MRPAPLTATSSAASAAAPAPTALVEPLETRLPGHETLRPVRHFPVEYLHLPIGSSTCPGYLCRAVPLAFAILEAKEGFECNCGVVRVGARVVGDRVFEYRFPYEFVAIKVQDKARVLQQLSPSYVGDSTLLEKALLTTLSDAEHIIRLIECWHDNMNLYSVMEYADGGDLVSYISSYPTAEMPEDDARYFFRQFLLGLDAIHRIDYCCRDLSPENAVIITESRVLKIIDLGACKRMGKDGQGNFLPFPPGVPFGKPAYMAPEYYAGREFIGTKVDFWACGCILYTMVTGEICFEFPSDEDPQYYRGEFTQKFLELNGSRVENGYPELSEELVGLLLHLLAVDPSMRPNSVAEILEHPWFTAMMAPVVATAAGGGPAPPAAPDADVDTAM